LFEKLEVFLSTNVSDILNRVPENQRPPKELIDTLRQDAILLFGDNNRFMCHITAPTPDRAKLLVEAYLRLYDYGISYPSQAEYLRAIPVAVKELARLREDLDKSRAVIVDCDKGLEGLKAYRDFTSEALATYHTQQLTLEVDLAGTKARIDACAKILERRKELPVSRVEQVETIKITAEIELASLTAKQSAIAEIVQNGERSLALQEKKRSSLRSTDRLQGDIRVGEQRIAYYAAQRKAWEECPISVIIHPLNYRGRQSGN
jgi:hypothetical protein